MTMQRIVAEGELKRGKWRLVKEELAYVWYESQVGSGYSTFAVWYGGTSQFILAEHIEKCQNDILSLRQELKRAAKDEDQTYRPNVLINSAATKEIKRQQENPESVAQPLPNRQKQVEDIRTTSDLKEYWRGVQRQVAAEDGLSDLEKRAEALEARFKKIEDAAERICSNGNRNANAEAEKSEHIAGRCHRVRESLEHEMGKLEEAFTMVEDIKNAHSKNHVEISTFGKQVQDHGIRLDNLNRGNIEVAGTLKGLEHQFANLHTTTKQYKIRAKELEKELEKFVKEVDDRMQGLKRKLDQVRKKAVDAVKPAKTKRADTDLKPESQKRVVKEVKPAGTQRAVMRKKTESAERKADKKRKGKSRGTKR